MSYYDLTDRDADEEFFYELLYIMTSYYKVSDYIHEITFNDSKYSGCYLKNTINIDKKRTLRKWQKILMTLDIPESERHIGELFYLSRVFLHELEHVNQEKTMHDNPTSLSGRILVESFCYNKGINNPQTREYLIRNNPQAFRSMQNRITNVYNDNYSIAPQERLAEIRANSICFVTARIKKLRISDYYLSEVYKNFLRGYDIEEEPTKAYILLINPDFNFGKIEILTQDMSQNDRCMYGLKVPSSHLSKLEYTKDKILSRTMKS